MAIFLIRSQIIKRWDRVLIEVLFYLEAVHLVVVWESPHGSQNVHSGKTHAQHVVAEAEIRRVDVGANGSLNLLGKRGTTGVRTKLGG